MRLGVGPVVRATQENVDGTGIASGTFDSAFIIPSTDGQVDDPIVIEMPRVDPDAKLVTTRVADPTPICVSSTDILSYGSGEGAPGKDVYLAHIVPLSIIAVLGEYEVVDAVIIEVAHRHTAAERAVSHPLLVPDDDPDRVRS